MSCMNPEFQEILAGCKSGDPASMRALMTEYYGTVMRVARKKVEDEETAKDLTQSFFLYLLETRLIFKFRGDGVAQFRSFLLACLRNFVETERRKNGRFIIHSEINPDSLESLHPGVEAEFDRNSIRELIAQIDWRYRQVLDLELESFRQREIAEILNLPPGTVASYSHRAKIELARLLRLHGFFALPFFLSILIHFSRVA